MCLGTGENESSNITHFIGLREFFRFLIPLILYFITDDLHNKL